MAVARLALARPAGRLGTGQKPLAAKLAMVTGLTGMAFGGSVAATADGGLGTGNGPDWAYLDLLVGLIGASLGALALTSARRRTG